MLIVLSCVGVCVGAASGYAGTPPDGVNWSGGKNGDAKLADVMAILTVADVNPKMNAKTSAGDWTEVDFKLPTGNNGIIWIGKRDAIDWQTDLRTVGGRPVLPDVANVEWVWGYGWRAVTRYGMSVAMSVNGYRGPYDSGSTTPRSAHPALPTMWLKLDEKFRQEYGDGPRPTFHDDTPMNTSRLISEVGTLMSERLGVQIHADKARSGPGWSTLVAARSGGRYGSSKLTIIVATSKQAAAWWESGWGADGHPVESGPSGFTEAFQPKPYTVFEKTYRNLIVVLWTAPTSTLPSQAVALDKLLSGLR